jgi:hypothetical protein
VVVAVMVMTVHLLEQPTLVMVALLEETLLVMRVVAVLLFSVISQPMQLLKVCLFLLQVVVLLFRVRIRFGRLRLLAR